MKKRLLRAPSHPRHMVILMRATPYCFALRNPTLLLVTASCASALMALTAPLALSAQTVPTVKLEKLTTIFGARGDTDFTRDYTVSVRRNGEILVAPSRDISSFVVYGPDGVFRRVVGSRGGGPGEFGVVRSVIEGPSDSIHVFESVPPRISVLSPDLKFVRVFQIPLSPSRSMLALPGGGYIVPGRLNTHDGLGNTVHYLRHNGEVAASVASIGTQVLPGLVAENRRSVGLAADGTVLSAHFSRYQIDLLSASGDSLGSITRSVDWFQPWSGRVSPLHVARPSPQLRAAFPLGDCCVIAVVQVADSRWKAIGPAQVPQKSTTETVGDETAPVNDYHKLVDTVFEVLDRNSGALLARHRVDGRYSPTLSPGILATERIDGDGHTVLSIWRIIVNEGENKPR